MRRVLLIFIALFLIWIPAQYALAFAVSPSTLETSGNRGETIQQKFNLVNTQDNDQTFYLDTIKFTAGDESGSPKFIPFEKDHSGLPEWLSFKNKAVTVPGRSWTEVNFTISIPADVASGGYYAAVTVSETSSEVVADNGATLQAKTAILIFLTVNGETQEKAGLLDFSVTPTTWTDQLAGNFIYRIQNQGNIHLTPTGTVIFKDIFGRTIAVVDANSKKSRTLPNTTRSFEDAFGKKENNFISAVKNEIATLAIGPIAANLEVVYGSNNQTLHATSTFWLIPWQLLLSIVGLFFIIFIVSRILAGISRKKFIS